MRSFLSFRIFAVAITLGVGLFFIGNLAAEVLRIPRVPLTSDRAAKTIAESDVASSKWATIAWPMRSDLNAEYALVLVNQALATDASQPQSRSTELEDAQNIIRKALRLGPYNSQMWLVLGLLQSLRNSDDQAVAETLKISYFTGPNLIDLAPLRLGLATSNNALKDPDLRDLARGDVRAILTRYPDRRQALVEGYLRASQVGKQFLEETTSSVDPEFVDALRSGR